MCREELVKRVLGICFVSSDVPRAQKQTKQDGFPSKLVDRELINKASGGDTWRVRVFSPRGRVFAFIDARSVISRDYGRVRSHPSEVALTLIAKMFSRSAWRLVGEESNSHRSSKGRRNN